MTLTAIKGDKTLVELSEQFNVHANQIAQWKNQLLNRAQDVFEGTGPKEPPDFDFYNARRLHSRLDRSTPDQVYFESLPSAEAA